jgi:chaperonin GroES
VGPLKWTFSGGSLCPDEADGKKIPLEVKAHDRILFGKYSGSEVKVDEEEHLIMKEEDLLAIIE